MGGKEPTYFLRARYLQAIQDAGGVPLVFPLTQHPPTHKLLLSQCSGLLVTGSGSDLAPRWYGERKRYPFTQMSEDRARLEIGLSKLAFREGVPTLGICGGMQSMNVALGGTLFQDIGSQIETVIEHRPSTSATKPTHSIRIESKTLLKSIAKKYEIPVNSSHHQSVKAVPSTLTINAVAPDGVIEGFESTAHTFWLGVQWHPEFLYLKDPIQKRVFSAFIAAAKTFRKS